MSFPANAFLIGAQKSGTTFLASLLNQCSDVCVSDPKEPHYLTHQFHKGETYYKDCFSTLDAKIRLDASTTYSLLRPRKNFDVPDAPGILDPVPQRIKENVPDAKLIFIMRDPVERAISSYRHLMRHEKVSTDPKSLVACLDADPMLELGGRYADQIERYLEVFSIEQFLFLHFDDLTRDPLAVAQKTCAFLGISAESIVLRPKKAESNSAYQTSAAGHALKGIARFLPGIRIAARRVLPKKVQNVVINRILREQSKITFYDLEAAAQRFAEDRARVKQLTGLTV